MEFDDQNPAGVRTLPRVPAGSSAGEAAASPPRLRIAPWLRVTSFVREDVGRFTRVTLEGELRSRSRLPRRLELVVARGVNATSYRPVAVQCERRAVIGGRRRARLGVRLTFAVPPALTVDRNSEFTLLARRRGAVELPFPGLVPWPEPGSSRLGLGVVASAAALGVGGFFVAPAGALAAGASTKPAVKTATCQPGTTGSGATSTTSPTPPGSSGTESTIPTSTPTGVAAEPPTEPAPTTSADPSTAGDPGAPPSPPSPTTTTGPTTGAGAPAGAGNSTSGTPATTQPPTTITKCSSGGSTTSTGTTPGTGSGTSGKGSGSSGNGSGTSGKGSGSSGNGSGSSGKGSGSSGKGSSGKGSSGNGSGSTGKPTKSTKPAKGKVKPTVAGAISGGAKAGAGAVTVTGSVKKTSGLKRADGNAPAPVVLQPTVVPPPSVTITPIGGDFGLTDLWGGGSPLSNPFSQLQLERFAAQARHITRPPKYLVKTYRQAGRRYHVPWEVLAAINYIETGYGSDLAVSSAGAVGWMQFMPSTWAEYGEAVSAHGLIMHDRLANPWVPRDAIFSAARLLVADGAHKNLAKAVYGYNHALWYVQEVLTLAQRITSRQYDHHAKPRQRVREMQTTAKLLNGIGYVWGGGHTSADWIVQAGYDCSGFVSAVLHAGGYLRFPQTTQTLAGERGIADGPGRWVTIFDRTDAGIDNDHVIIDLNGYFWEEGGGGPAGASMVHLMRHISGSYLRSFNVVLHPRGL